MASTAVNAQGTTIQIATGTGGAKTISAIQVGNPTILTSAGHGLSNGDSVALALFAGANAATLNGVQASVQFKTTNTIAVGIDTTGLTITAGSATATPNTYSNIGNIKTFNGPDGSANEIETSNLDSVAKEIMMGLPDSGTVSLETDSDDANAGQAAAFAAWQNRTLKAMKINLSTGKVLSFSAYVKKFARTGGVDAPHKSGIDLRITGAVTLT